MAWLSFFQVSCSPRPETPVLGVGERIFSGCPSVPPMPRTGRCMKGTQSQRHCPAALSGLWQRAGPQPCAHCLPQSPDGKSLEGLAGPPALLAAWTGLLTGLAGAEEALQDVAVRKQDPQDHLGQDKPVCQWDSWSPTQAAVPLGPQWPGLPHTGLAPPHLGCPLKLLAMRWTRGPDKYPRALVKTVTFFILKRG